MSPHPLDYQAPRKSPATSPPWYVVRTLPALPFVIAGFIELSFGISWLARGDRTGLLLILFALGFFGVAIAVFMLLVWRVWRNTKKQ
jgi:hypothetical protein